MMTNRFEEGLKNINFLYNGEINILDRCILFYFV